VLRGERGRFQLFGDTVNTAARIESTGESGRIHLSQECADLLVASGKSHWVEKRSDLVHAKGKGELQTYWLTRTTTSPLSDFNGSVIKKGLSCDVGVSLRQFKAREFLNEREHRLIQWNIQRFTALLEAIAAYRGNRQKADDRSSATLATDSCSVGSSILPFEEVKEVIEISTDITFSSTSRPMKGRVDPLALNQLEEYITIIAGMYDNHAFHK
jgi:hypothetical protein